MNTPEIEELKSLVEQKYGKLLATTTDFEEFSFFLEKHTGGKVSPSTLKRLYGYVSDNHKPRMVTLDILAQYIGHKNYMEFKQWLKTSTRYNSSFFKASQLVSSDLKKGTEAPTAFCAYAIWAKVPTKYLPQKTASLKQAIISLPDASSRSSRSICLTSSETASVPHRSWQEETEVSPLSASSANENSIR